MRHAVRWAGALALLFSLWCHAQPEPAEPPLMTRDCWTWDRADIGWYSGKEPAQKTGPIKDMSGWAEYDFAVPATGWYELYLTGGVPGWDRDVFLDGARIFRGASQPEDYVTRRPEVVKQANLPLSAGTHTLRLRRLGFPGCLPSSWELREAGGPGGRITAQPAGPTVLRAGEALALKVTGGAGPAQRYTIVFRREGTETWEPAATVNFPASAGFITRTVKIPCTTEGVFSVRAQAGEALLRPVDLLPGQVAVIATKRAPTAAASMKKTLLHDIDCVAQTDRGTPVIAGKTYWEANGATRISTSPAGTYRESGDNNDPDIPFAQGTQRKSLAAFSYLADVPQSGGPYLLEVDYPDDDRRTVNVVILENTKSQAGYGYPAAQLGSGYESGDWFPLTNRMHTHQVIFWTKSPQIRVALVSMNPGMRAAAARIRVYQLDEGLPAGPAHRADGRRFGSFMEEPGRWGAHFRTITNYGDESMQADFTGIERWMQLNRYLGINYVQPTEAIYQSPTYSSDVLEGWFVRAYDAPRIVALMCEKYGLQYVPELHISWQGWFNSRVMKKLVANPDEIYIRNWLGGYEDGVVGNSYHPVFNALHPAVQAKYLEIVGELTDKVSDSPAFAGLSLRLMGWVWQSWNAIPSLNWGYEDWTVNQFSKETGITVPGAADDPGRFQQRYAFLTAPAMRERWITWRCDKMLDLYRRLRDRIRRQRPDAVLYLPYYGEMDISLGAASDRPAEILREMGIDLARLAQEPGIALVPGGSFGRRDSSPIADQKVFDPLLDPEHKALGFGFERAFQYGNAYFEVHEQIAVDRLGFPEIPVGGYCGAADGAGRHMLERLSVVLADQDSSTLYQGGLGYTFGQPAYMQEWLAEYGQLPKLPFTPRADARDPVAVWSRACPDGLYWYAVNRESYPVTLTVTLAKATGVTALGSGKTLALSGGQCTLTLDAYQLRAFRAPRGASITACATAVPAEQIALVKQRLAACQQLADAITTGSRQGDVTEEERAAFLRNLQLGWEALAHKQYWRARTVLSMAPMVAVFAKLGAYPAGQVHRLLPDVLQTERTEQEAPPAAPVVTAAELARMVVPGSAVTLIDSGTYHRDWQHAQVLRSAGDTLQLDLTVPTPGAYRLSLGHVAPNYGAMLVRLGAINMTQPAVTRALNTPERTVFPVVTLPAGTLRLTLVRPGGIGLYGLVLQPVYHAVPSKYWSTIGPFPTAWHAASRDVTLVKAALTTAYPPEAGVTLDATYTGADGKQVRWEQSDSTVGRLMDRGVNFIYRAKVSSGAVCYAATYITSPDDREVQIQLGVDWWATAYLNGTPLTSTRPAQFTAEDGATFNGYKPTAATLSLKKGVNVLLVKCHGGSVASSFILYVNDPGDLKFAPRP